MHVSQPPFFDVLIAGAGPVGLLLACELRLGGCTVQMIEKAPDPHSVWKRSPTGLRGLTVPTTEYLDRRGLLAPLIQCAASSNAASAAHWMNQVRKPGGHFAGIPFFIDHVDTTQWPFRLTDPAEILAVDMASVEAVLLARALARGVDIVRGYAVDDVESSAEGVTVRANGKTFNGRWLVGCDGGRSAVRKAAGFDFTGTEPEFTGYSIQADFADDSVMLTPGRQLTANGMVSYQPPCTIAMVEFDGGAGHRNLPLTLAHVQSVLRRISGIAVTLNQLTGATTWTDRAFQATAYRKGRVLLAGDAAHIHSPLGGQGLNLGLADAMNLGWKLAATVRNDAPEALLDSYFHERHPAAASVLEWSRAQVALMRPDPGARALATVLRDLVATRDGTTYMAERVWGVSLQYDLGNGHPLVGRSAPDFVSIDGTKMNEQLTQGRALLLDFSADAQLRSVASRWTNWVAYVACDVQETLGTRAVLLRPDGIVAWACADTADLDSLGLAQAATRWFGEPGCPTAA